MHIGTLIIAIAAVLLTAQAAFSLYLMLYTWEHPERLEASRGPRSFLPPRLAFTVLVPARHEERVIRGTVERVLAAHYPANLIEVVVICHASDTGTIAEALRAGEETSRGRVRVETFVDEPINKPHGLNVGLARSGNEVVTVFDAEDDVHPDIFSVINTVMQEEETGIVQAGVQLMNFRDHWFSIHNCLEYFFYFKSRLHFHAKVGMIPLGGNTVFIRRSLLERVGGWDQRCLTEDADIGLRLSALGEPIRVIYNAQHVTREETPATIAQFIRQRTRWNQGFLQILRRGTWLQLPGLGRRLLALYTLAYPLLQAALLAVWPLGVVVAIAVRVPVPIVLLTFLPLYALGLQLLVAMVGAYQFCREYNYRFPLLLPISMAVSFVPFQWLLGISAVRAVVREMRRESNWEKTAHVGAHRRRQQGWAPAPAALERLLDEVGAGLGAERSSVLILDPATNSLRLVASRGVPAWVARMPRIAAGEGIAGWVARSGRPAVLDGRALPEELGSRLSHPELRSAVVLPILHEGTTVGVLNVASATHALGDTAVAWLDDQITKFMYEAPYGPQTLRSMIATI